MKRYFACLPTIILLTSMLGACAPFHFSDHRAGVCNELNSQIVFSGGGGGTSNNREAEIANSEMPLARHSYDKRCTS